MFSLSYYFSNNGDSMFFLYSFFLIFGTDGVSRNSPVYFSGTKNYYVKINTEKEYEDAYFDAHSFSVSFMWFWTLNIHIVLIVLFFLTSSTPQ